MDNNSQTRHIDREDRKRQKPMKVLVLGLCRTGTTPLIAALRKLGYTPHHLREVLSNPWQIPLWQEAIELNILPRKPRSQFEPELIPYGREEFDKLLGAYDVVTDIPSVIFAEHLIKAYPDVKVILTVRNYDSWENSMQATLWPMLTDKLFIIDRMFKLTAFAHFGRLLHAIFAVHNGNQYGGPEARKAFDAHNAHIRDLVPRDQLLEFGPKFEWEPLCEFLGHDIPAQPYPHLDDTEAWRKSMNRVWWMVAKQMALMVIMPGFLIVGTFTAYIWSEELQQLFNAHILEPLKTRANL